MKSLAFGIKRFLQEEEGATMVEYGLMLALIAIICVTVIGLIGTSLRDQVFQVVADCLANPASCPGGGGGGVTP